MLLGFLVSCESNTDSDRYEKIYHENDFGVMYYDTIKVHNVEHEFIVIPANVHNVYNHSPECWCLKEKTK
jgi:hypothetical protein